MEKSNESFSLQMEGDTTLKLTYVHPSDGWPVEVRFDPARRVVVTSSWRPDAEIILGERFAKKVAKNARVLAKKSSAEEGFLKTYYPTPTEKLIGGVRRLFRG